MKDDVPTPQPLFIELSRRDRITAISGAVQRRPIVLVLGMHRSGTSLCSHFLSALGVDMADNIPGPGLLSPAPDNPWGHWERWEIVEFHDRIFSLFNRDYSGRLHDFALPVAWWADPRVVQIRREIVAFLERRMRDAYFGFKDPRTVRLMPIWYQILGELKLAPKVVLCLRNPAQVARSLHARDGLDPAIGEYRWLVHMIDFFRYTNGLDFCTVEYEGWFDNPAANIERLQKFLDLSWQQSEADLGLLLSDVIDSTARHDDPAHYEAGQPLVRTLYKLARRAGEDGARDQISYIVSQFVGFQQLQRPFLRAFEDVAQVVAKYAEIEQEAAVLRAAVETAEHRANTSEANLADAVAKIEGQFVQIAEIARERDDHAELAREAGGLRETLAEHEAALAEVTRRADELVAALQVAQAELEAREAALRRAEQEAQERNAAAEAIQVEVVMLRDALTQAEQTGQECAAAADGLRAEVVTLWDTLAQAEGEAQECAVAAEAMQAEVATLQEALAQAEGQAQERAVAAEAMQAEVATLQEALAQAEGEAQERAAAAEAMEAEVATLQEALAQAASEAQERAVAAEAKEAEVATLREVLAQAEGEAQEHAVAGKATLRELTALRGALAEVEREAQQRADGAQTFRAEVKALRATLAKAEHEVQQRAVEARALEVEVGALRGSVAQGQAEAQECAVAGAVVQAEIVTLRDALTRAERGERERTAVAAALEAEVGVLRETLARAEGEAGESAAAGAALQSEIAGLRETLARAEGKAQERAAAGTALQAEIAALQGTLTAARHVGRTAIAALQIGGAVPMKPDRPRGWQQAIMRFLGAGMSF